MKRKSAAQFSIGALEVVYNSFLFLTPKISWRETEEKGIESSSSLGTMDNG
jgi:hypothetical protein